MAGKWHTSAEPDLTAAVGRVFDDVYGVDLKAAGVRVTPLFAHAARNDDGEPKGPAIVVGGMAAAVTVKVVPQRDRVAGLDDVLLIVDGDSWPEMSAEDRLAVIDHGLQQIELVIDPDSDQGAPLLDDCNRPKLRKRRPDFAVAGYASVVSRHGLRAPEAKALESAGRLVREWAPAA